MIMELDGNTVKADDYSRISPIGLVAELADAADSKSATHPKRKDKPLKQLAEKSDRTAKQQSSEKSALRALDLFCVAGGASRGLQQAGFHVTGVDINPRPRYAGDVFIQADAMTFPLEGFDFIWASPPCQKYSTMTKRWGAAQSDTHPDLIAPVRMRLQAASVPYSIENVPGAPLRNPLLLCGSMFGLAVRRHRIFEASHLILGMECRHKEQGRVVGVYGHAGGSSKRDGIKFGGVSEWRVAMAIDWMTGDELAEAIPPAYSQYIGQQMIRHILAATAGKGAA